MKRVKNMGRGKLRMGREATEKRSEVKEEMKKEKKKKK